MHRPVSVAVLLSLAVTLPAAAQGNPFKLPLRSLPAYTVEYTYGGDMTGTGRSTSGGDKMASRSTMTGKFFGKTSTTSSWSLTDPEVIWNADLEKKKGTKMVNPLPSMAKAYDELDGAGKTRFQENIQSMAAFVTRALPGTPFEGKVGGTKTIAGERCTVKEFGAFTFCTMDKAPVALYSAGSLLCVNFEQTATSVARTTDASMFDPPADIKWTEDLDRTRADSSARAWIQQLASKELADSLAAAKAKAKEAGAGEGEMTPEQQKQVCDALKNFDLGKAMSNAFKNAMADAGKNALKNGLRGLIKRP